MGEGIVSTKRPSHLELTRKLRAAGRLLDSGCWAPADPSKLAANFDDLGLFLAEEQAAALRAVVAEVRPEDYVGGRPPERSYERMTPGVEMFAFGWHSTYFGRPMYFKFSIGGSGTSRRLYVYSLHPSRRRARQS
jgi:hypothetical protein